MKSFFLIALLLSIVIACSSSSKFESGYFEKYAGYTVYQVTIKGQEDLKALDLIEKKLKNKLDYWTEHKRSGYVHVMIKPDLKLFFEEALKFAKLEFDVYIQDVATLIKKQIDLNEAKVSASGADFDYGKYHTLDEINHWMNDLESAYPKLVTVFNVSRSYQKRDIYALKISVPNASKKPAIWLDGGIHAREWYVKK